MAYAEFPERTITNLRKAGPGSMVDRLDQLFEKMAPEYLGVKLVTLYRKGCSGCNAQAYVQKKPADGYHIFLDTTTTALVLAMGKVPFDENDWNFIIRLQVDPEGLAIRADAPWKDLKEMMAWAKANPGKLRICGAHAQGMDPFTVRLLAKAAGVEVTYLPLEGASEMIAHLLGRHVDAAILNPGEAEEYVEARKFKMVGIGHHKRLDQFPDWPTFKEQGFDVVSHMWRGVFVKAGTPKDIIKKLADAFNAMRQDKRFIEFNESSGQIHGYMGGPDKTDAWFKNQIKSLREAFKK